MLWRPASSSTPPAPPPVEAGEKARVRATPPPSDSAGVRAQGRRQGAAEGCRRVGDGEANVQVGNMP